MFHAGCIGADGDFLADMMSESGVNTKYLKKVDGKNGHAIIQVTSSGENSIFLYPGSNEMVTKEYIDTVISNFEAGDILLLQNEISNVSCIVEKAFDKNMCIMLNPSPFNEKISEIDFSKLSYLLLNEIEAKCISGSSSVDEAIGYLQTNYPGIKIILTLGSKGSVYFYNSEKTGQKAYKVTAVDTTAAGDTFTGYFASGLSKGLSVSESLNLASMASAISVTRNGAAPSIPVLDEVLKGLKEFC